MKLINNRYTKKNKNALLKESLCNGLTAKHVSVSTGEPDVFQVTVEEELCPHTIDAFEKYCRMGKLKGSLTQLLANDYVDKIQHINEKLLWAGNEHFDGLLKLGASATNFAEIFAENQSCISKLRFLLPNAPKELREADNQVIFCSQEFFDAYCNELKGAGIQPEHTGNVLLMPNTNIKLVASPGIEKTNIYGEPIIYTTSDNILISTDLADDREKFSISQESKESPCVVTIEYYLSARYKDLSKVVVGYTFRN